MKRILSILTLCIGGLVASADTANAQFFNYSTRLGNSGRLTIGNYPAYGGFGYGYPGYGYGYARPGFGYGYPAYGYPAYGYGYRPVYGYPAYGYGNSFNYGRPYGYGWRR